MKNYICLFWLLTIGTFSFAQQTHNQKIDSLQKLIKNYGRQDTVLINYMIELSFLYYYQAPEKMIHYAPKIVSVSRKLNFSRGIYRGLSFFTYHYIKTADYNKSIRYVLEKCELAEKENNALEKADSYSILGYLYTQLGNNNEQSIKYYLLAKEEVLKLPKSHSDYYSLLVSANSNISMGYVTMKKLDLALQYNAEAIAIFKKYNRVSSVENYYKEAVLYSNQASTLRDLGKYHDAILHAKKALEISLKYNFTHEEAGIYISLCKSFTKQGKFKQANIYLEKLTELSENIHLDPNWQMEYLISKADLEAATGNYKEAYSSYLKMTSLKDSINGIEQKNKINQLSTQYESDKKESKIKQLQQANTIAETQRKLYLGISSFLLILVVVAGVAIWQVRKAHQKAEAANRQRDRLFSIVAHDLRSPVANLQHITSTINYALKKNNSATINLLVNAIEESAVSLYKLVDNLLQWSLIQQGFPLYRPSHFAIQADIEDLIQSFRSRANLKNVEILFNKSTNPIIKADRMAIQTILRNLLDNALKFSPMGEVIRVELIDTTEYIEMRISDNGRGIPEEVLPILFVENAPQKSCLGSDGEKGTGIGLFVCQKLAQMNNAEIKVLSSSEKGTTFSLRMFNKPKI